MCVFILFLRVLSTTLTSLDLKVERMNINGKKLKRVRTKLEGSLFEIEKL